MALLVVLMLWGVWHGTRLQSLTIASVSSHDGPTVAATLVEGVAAARLEGTYFRLVPRRFAWLYPEQEIVAELLDQERISTVDLTVHDGTKLEIDFTEHIPTALWCATDTNAPCLFVDESGFAFTVAPELRGGSFMRYVTPEQSPALGAVVAPPSQLGDAEWFLDQLDTVLQLYPERVQLYEDGRMTYELSNGGRIMVADRHDPVDTFRYLETLLQSDEYSELRSEDFQYIDLRFGNKLFVNRTVATTTASTTTASSTPVVLTPDTIATRTAATSTVE